MSGGGLPLSRRVWLGCLALSGVLAAHLISYFIAAPHPHERRALLEVTGHGSQNVMFAVAIAAFVAAVAAFVPRWLASSPRRPASHLRCPVAMGLVAMQTVGFLGLEAVERIHAHGTASGLLSEPAVLIGLVAQVAVAIIGSLLLVVVAETVEVLTRRGHHGARATMTPVAIPAALPPVRLTVVARGWTLRGPPSLLSF
jgi:hypothetical protein